MRRNLQSSRGLMRSVVWVTLLAPLGAMFGCQPPARDSDALDEARPPTVVYLVRHAEKSEINPSDPGLSEAGQTRAAVLTHLLKDAPLDAVWSTDTRRTRNTAAAVAEAADLAVELYDPRGIAAFAESLKARGGRHLVVGHSNTTPGLVEALGGDPGSGIVDPEYDRFYIVTVGPTGHVETVLLRFGEPFVGA